MVSSLAFLTSGRALKIKLIDFQGKLTLKISCPYTEPGGELGLHFKSKAYISDLGIERFVCFALSIAIMLQVQYVLDGDSVVSHSAPS